MLCIASFIVFVILGIFSATYRQLAEKAWYCVFRRITFRPCDIEFDKEVKGRILGVLMRRSPVLARFFHRWSNVLATLFVVLSVWSLLAVMYTGVNLYVYDTCTPNNAESCSLGGEACGVSRGHLVLTDAVREGRILEWLGQPLYEMRTTISMIPMRMKKWDGREFLTDGSTFLRKYDDIKPVALEIIDPGCRYCAELMRNITESGFDDRYNLTYIAYPIPTDDGYKFRNSYLIARYLEAVKTKPLQNSETPADWRLLKTVFLEKNNGGDSWQDVFNLVLSEDEAEVVLQDFLKDMGYSDDDIVEISKMAHSDEIRRTIETNREIVEQKIRTIKIPTIIFGGRRFDRVVDVDILRKK